jgi:hypothetical protein
MITTFLRKWASGLETGFTKLVSEYCANYPYHCSWDSLYNLGIRTLEGALPCPI